LEKVSRIEFRGGGSTRYIEATTHGVRVASIYVPHGKSVGDPAYEEKIAFLEDLRHHVDPYRDEFRSTVLGGDWNVAPLYEDVWNPLSDELFLSPRGRGALGQCIQRGWRDSLMGEERNSGNRFTWWPYWGDAWERGEGARIDLFLLSPWAADLYEGAGISHEWRGRENPSDHVPIWIELKEKRGTWPEEKL
jgi:exodeoxyribonuclease-3